MRTCPYVRGIGLPAVDKRYSEAEVVVGTGVRTSPGYKDAVEVVDFDA